MNHIGLFEGIGGFSLAAQWMNWKTIAYCEINPFCQKVLKYHFPKANQHEDIKTTDFTIYRGQCDIVTGGFPCQPYSVAGKRKGKEDDRHLWPEMLRAIREIQPSWVVGENVSGLTTWDGGLVFNEVQADLEAEGYEILPFLLPACAVNAPHRRDRIWFIAHSNTNGSMRATREDESKGRKERIQERDEVQQPNEPDSIREFSSDPNGLRGPQEHELQQTELSKQHGKGWDAANPKSNRKHRTQKFENGSGQSGERRRCDINNTSEVSRQNGCSDATDTKCRTIQELQHEPDFLGQESSGWEAGGFNDGSTQDYWERWPTQPPLCWRDDGVSPELSGITFSKHRKESIKAYGNAIVPQVALEIFKAIQSFENLNTN